MRKLKKGEFVEIHGRGEMNTDVYKLLVGLKVGEEAVVDKEDWNGETPLSHTIHNKPSLRGKFSCLLLKDRSGWYIHRIK